MTGFPAWVLLSGAVSLVRPETTAWLSGDAVVALLSVAMAGMGTSITPAQLGASLRMPRPVLVGFALQYSVMPLCALAAVHATGLAAASPALAAGVLLTGVCPGGTASNIVSFIAGADVPLSVLMTCASTLAACALTPALAGLLLGTVVPVDAAAMLASTLKVVTFPVLAGVALSAALPEGNFKARLTADVMPLLAVAAVALICGNVVAQSASALRGFSFDLAARLLLAVTALHAGGFALGYALPKSGLGYEETASRTIAIEVGMQNSALGAVLARAHLADPLSAVPCAVSATVHSILGSTLAALWRARDRDRGRDSAVK